MIAFNNLVDVRHEVSSKIAILGNTKEKEGKKVGR